VVTQFSQQTGRRLCQHAEQCKFTHCEISLYVWSQEQEPIIQELNHIASFVSTKEAIVGHIDLVDILMLPSQEANSSNAAMWRRACGREVPQSGVAEDIALRALWQLATPVYPAFLLPRSSEATFLH
jgi:hypothetical protein